MFFFTTLIAINVGLEINNPVYLKTNETVPSALNRRAKEKNTFPRVRRVCLPRHSEKMAEEIATANRLRRKSRETRVRLFIRHCRYNLQIETLSTMPWKLYPLAWMQLYLPPLQRDGEAVYTGTLTQEHRGSLCAPRHSRTLATIKQHDIPAIYSQ